MDKLGPYELNTIVTGDNLEALKTLKAQGAKFDLVELDGPYMAGLEDWDNLTEDEYIQHYADRLTLVRDILQPWGVVFVFGYPEGCAEIKSWAHRSGVLYLRRWIHWYNNRATHQGRFIQVALMFVQNESNSLVSEFRQIIKARRKEMGITIEQAHNLTGISPGCRGGYIWYESDTGRLPGRKDYLALKQFFNLPQRYDLLPDLYAFQGLTDIDVLRVPVEQAIELNDNSLRSKPIQLYLDLFKPTIPPTENRKALILYGGSGNAGIAAAALGYETTICERDTSRVEVIKWRWAKEVNRWQRRVAAVQSPLFIVQPEQVVMSL